MTNIRKKATEKVVGRVKNSTGKERVAALFAAAVGFGAVLLRRRRRGNG